MFDDLCFADRTNDSRFQERMIISVYKVIRVLKNQNFASLKNFISLYFETGNEQQNEAVIFRFPQSRNKIRIIALLKEASIS
jgi:hypothetical protein